MKNIIVLIVVFVCFYSCNSLNPKKHGSRFDSATWQEIIDEEANFKVKFPNYDLEKGSVNDTVNGIPVQRHFYSLNLQNENLDNLAYRLDCSIYPSDKTKKEKDLLFINQKKHLASYNDVYLESETLIDSLNYYGRDMTFSLETVNLKTRYRLFFHNGIFYKLTVITKNNSEKNKALMYFLNSFEILE